MAVKKEETIKVKISEFLKYYDGHAVETSGKVLNPPPGQYGYVMGADGRIATGEYIMQQAKACYGSAYERYFESYKKWIGRKVFDCNAIAEAFYKMKTAISIDSLSRKNYADWCGIKSPTTPDPLLTSLPQLPGIAVFSGESHDAISHIGYLFKKYGPGPTDWLVLECRGRDYGLVLTKLTSRSWSWWGKMDKYFDYDIGSDWQPINQSKEYKVQCGTYVFRSSAEKLKAKLAVAGFKDTAVINTGTAYKVQCGSFSIRANAETLVTRIKAAGYNSKIV